MVLFVLRVLLFLSRLYPRTVFISGLISQVVITRLSWLWLLISSLVSRDFTGHSLSDRSSSTCFSPFATCFKHIIQSNGDMLQLLLNYCLLVDSVSNMFHAIIGHLFSFVAICLLNFPVTELFTHLVICLLLNLLRLDLWAGFYVILRSAEPCAALGNTVF